MEETVHQPHAHTHDHTHTHSHGSDHDWEALGDQLEREAELHIPAVTEAAHWLRDLLGLDGGGQTRVGRVLDVGSGPGVAACLLAAAFPDAEVVAVDQAPGLLERVRTRAAGLHLADRVATLRTDLPSGFDSLGSADLIWSGNAIHHLGDQQAALAALAASLRPGGLLAVAERGLPPRFLPRDIGIGRPGLQARLDAANEELFGTMRAQLPGSTETVEDWPAMLARAGLMPSGTRTFLTDLPAPLGRPAREYLYAQLSRLRDRLGDRLDREDRETLDLLVDGDARTGIRSRPDAFYLTAITVHTARAPRPA
ncbi:class I SAM-dependent methyltransferase [Peterkaempfera bronchialis]|uniref:class I SAM-dependent methyltransferase n=1 Tax=Peterkaempfera bronchialis TaxID=2126346 RepID=UPI003C306168